MTSPAPLKVLEGIDELEALANGEVGFDTEDTALFFEHPRANVLIRTPNSSTIRVIRVLKPQCNGYDLWVMAQGEVMEAPQCPEYKDQFVTFLVNQDGSVCLLEER